MHTLTHAARFCLPLVVGLVLMGRAGSQEQSAPPRVLASAAPTAAQPTPAQTAPQPTRPPSILAWSPKPAHPGPWVSPNRPHWELARLLAAHRGNAGWSQTVVSDRDFTARYVSMAPGEMTKTQFYADDRVFWVVQEGRIRVSIEGVEPFVATKGFLVQVPYRVPYRLATEGDSPALRFEVSAARAVPLYPISETPSPASDRQYEKVSISGRGKYDDLNKPYIDFLRDIVQGGGRGGPFVKDDKTWANIIRGPGQPPPPETNKGHFHVDFSEFWLILEGQVDYLIEGQPLLTAKEGDVVYVPQGRWHRATSAGTGMATRLAINPRPDGLHNYQPQD
jgi:mannose-6-phosphate isomerase-like protein (cupin superfamily)